MSESMALCLSFVSFVRGKTKEPKSKIEYKKQSIEPINPKTPGQKTNKTKSLKTAGKLTRRLDHVTHEERLTIWQRLREKHWLKHTR